MGIEKGQKIKKLSQKCKQCSSKENGKNNIKDDFEVGVNEFFQGYKSNAKKRNIKFDLNFDQFKNIVKQNCYYCDELPSNIFHTFGGNHNEVRKAVYSGIDRIDSCKGYTIDNCVPCCFHCNIAKLDYSQEQFLQWIKKIYTQQFKRLSEKTPGIITDELFTVNTKLWFLQEDIMTAPENSDKALMAAKKAQDLNAKRNKLIRTLDDLFDYSADTYTEKSYATEENK